MKKRLTVKEALKIAAEKEHLVRSYDPRYGYGKPLTCECHRNQICKLVLVPRVSIALEGMCVFRDGRTFAKRTEQYYINKGWWNPNE